jgi:hypothetical protein
MLEDGRINLGLEAAVIAMPGASARRKGEIISYSKNYTYPSQRSLHWSKWQQAR